MKVMASVKRICRNCKVIKRHGVVRVICTDPRHKQRQRLTRVSDYATDLFKEQSWPVLLALTFRRISTPRSA